MSYVDQRLQHLRPSTPANRAEPGLQPFGLALARVLDRAADAAIMQGYHLQAEKLSVRAAELREAAQ